MLVLELKTVPVSVPTVHTVPAGTILHAPRYRLGQNLPSWVPYGGNDGRFDREFIFPDSRLISNRPDKKLIPIDTQPR